MFVGKIIWRQLLNHLEKHWTYIAKNIKETNFLIKLQKKG